MIKIRGIDYHYERHTTDPNKPDLLLLHGFMGSGELFDHLIEPLSVFANPITIDLLGHGKSEGAELHYRFSTKEQVADLVKFISEQLRLPVFLYGYSMGGRLALQLALHRPDLFKGVILESATFGIENETERQARQAHDASRADQITGNFEGFLKEWASHPTLQSDLSDSTQKRIKTIQQHQNPYWIANSLLAFGTGTMPCVREQLNTIQTPTLLLTGKKDPKFLSINQTMAKELADADLRIFEQAGHRIHQEVPKEATQAINQFLKRILLS
jgi:2-succinyl-6-hydroxy-2,4-cyclohexadiene-1-carboxylate synthase